MGGCDVPWHRHGLRLPLLGAKETWRDGGLQEAASLGSEHVVCVREATHKPHPDAPCRTAAAHGCRIPPLPALPSVLLFDATSPGRVKQSSRRKSMLLQS